MPIIHGDALTELKKLPSQSVSMCVTSPPYYGLRDYGNDGQIGLEQTPDEYIAKLVEVFREVRRVLRDDGTLWLNIGDSYAGNGKRTTRCISNDYKRKRTKGTALKQLNNTVKGMKPKDLIGIPWMLAFALRSDGWYLRQDIIWHKPNPIPESVKDRCTKSHEYLFLLSKSQRYYCNMEAIKEPTVTSGSCNSFKRETATIGVPDKPKQHRLERKDVEYSGLRNKRSVWKVPTRPYKGAHFATFPPELIRPCIKAGCIRYGVVLDPFFGAGTTGMVALEEGQAYIGIEINKEYVDIAKQRIRSICKQLQFPS